MSLFDPLAPALSLLRRIRGLTIDQLVERSGISRCQLEAFESAAGRPDLATLDRLLDALDATLEHLQWALNRSAVRPVAVEANAGESEDVERQAEETTDKRPVIDLPYPVIDSSDDEICEPREIPRRFATRPAA